VRGVDWGPIPIRFGIMAAGREIDKDSGVTTGAGGIKDISKVLKDCLPQ
jgi:hypothetical protein